MSESASEVDDLTTKVQLAVEIDNWVKIHRNLNGSRLWLWSRETECEQVYQIVSPALHEYCFTVADVNNLRDTQWFLTRNYETCPHGFWSFGTIRLTASTHAATVWAQQVRKSLDLHRSTLYNLALPVKALSDIVLSYLLL